MARTDAAPGQVDCWLLGEQDILIKKVTEAMEGYHFDEAFRAIRVFAWEILADNYIELVKARLYEPGGKAKKAAQGTLYITLETLMRLLSPFTPFLAEEIYHTMTGESVHSQPWPQAAGQIVVDPSGLMIKEIAAVLRRYKAEKGMALNAPLPGISVYSALALETEDLEGVANSPVEARQGSPDIEMRATAVKPQMKVLGPIFKGQSSRIAEALAAMDPSLVASQKAAGSIWLKLDGEMLEIPPESAEVTTETLSAGRAVDVLEAGGATVLVRR
jgi:valyl-tRNA synthetase